MLKMIRQLFSLLTSSQIRQFYILQLLVVVMAFTELVGIASIAPFMALVGDISLLEKAGLFAELYQWSGVSNPMDFLFYTGLVVLLTLTLSSAISMFTIWKLSLYASKVGTEIADSLYTHYMQQDWLFFASGSSAHLTKQISIEALRVTDQIIQPLMTMNSKLVLAIFILAGIFIYDPLVALGGSFLFVGFYILLYRLMRKRLELNGRNMSKIFTKRFRLMNESFGGIKDVLLLDRRHDFMKQFNESGKVLAYARGTSIAISQVPRYFMELVVFGIMISLVLLLIKLHEGNLGTVLPILAVYALAAFKLLPALQQIYSSIAQIKGNISAFDAIKGDLGKSFKSKKDVQADTQQLATKESTVVHLSPTQKINLNNITFSYPGKLSPTVNGLNMSIPVNSVVGLVGASGSGKSTTIDLLLGLIIPQQGELRIDDSCINDGNKRAWQNSIGFVPQSIFLSEGTIAENVAFGLSAKDINLNQVKKSLQFAHLADFIDQLPNGLHTKVGERGVQLSGGQRQRIGIARALYNETDVLVFDEATSALDGITEKIIMETIYNFNGKKTIIMIAHRLKTVQKCDIIFLMDRGAIVAQGTYQQLVETNAQFKEMTLHA
jgi:ATP-binding cassette, subfamily B, bacterial PglK